MIAEETPEIPEMPRLIIEADDDGCARYIGTLIPDNNYGINEPLSVLIWIWADGSIHMATRPTQQDMGWSIPNYPHRI